MIGLLNGKTSSTYWLLGKVGEFSSRRSAEAVVGIQPITADVIYWPPGNIHDSLIAALA